jgi:hypothetical protein
MGAVVIGVLRDFSPEPQDSIYFLFGASMYWATKR